MTTAALETKAGKSVRLYGILVLVAGILFIIAGGVTWFMVRDQLLAEDIVVPDDARAFAGRTVAGPFTAFAQADIINTHALEASGGATYAELDRDDPARATVMNASFLRASLFTSVVSFGVAAMAAALGIVLILVGLALMRVGDALVPASATGVGERVEPVVVTPAPAPPPADEAISSDTV